MRTTSDDVARARDGLLVVAEYTAEAVYGLIHPQWRRTGASGVEWSRLGRRRS